MLAKLREAKKLQTLVSVYLKSTDSFSTGFVDLVTDHHVRLKSVSKYAEIDGYEVRSINEIQMISYGGKYETKLSLLIDLIGEKDQDIKLTQKIFRDDLIYTTIKQAHDNKLLLIIWLDDDSSIIGFVEDMSSTTITILSVDDYGKEDGHIIVNIKNITDLDCNTKKLKCIKMLYQMNKGSK